MKEIIDAATSAESLSQSFAVRVAGFEQLVTDRTTQAMTNADRYSNSPGEGDRGTRSMVRKATRDAAQREVREYHRNLVASTEAERITKLKALKELDTRAIQLEPLYESPVQVLSREGLGSPERSRYLEQLASAGPRELKNYADWAVARGDRVLAAAVLSRLDATPKDRRPVQATEFAEKFVGKELREVRDALRRTRIAVQAAINVNRDFERNRTDAVAKIGLGLARRRA